MPYRLASAPRMRLRKEPGGYASAAPGDELQGKSVALDRPGALAADPEELGGCALVVAGQK